MRRVLALFLAWIPLALATCGPTPTSSPSTPTPGATLVIPPEAAAAADAAMADAAAYLQINPDLLQLEQVQPRQWSDASLGCPQPGQLYSQVITPGFLIVISSTASGHRLEYHTDARARVTLCSES